MMWGHHITPPSLSSKGQEDSMVKSTLAAAADGAHRRNRESYFEKLVLQSDLLVCPQLQAKIVCAWT